jgi:hypothetical protein
MRRAMGWAPISARGVSSGPVNEVL